VPSQRFYLGIFVSVFRWVNQACLAEIQNEQNLATYSIMDRYFSYPKLQFSSDGLYFQRATFAEGIDSL
jgi:hypothetical protein